MGGRRGRRGSRRRGLRAAVFGRGVGRLGTALLLAALAVAVFRAAAGYSLLDKAFAASAALTLHDRLRGAVLGSPVVPALAAAGVALLALGWFRRA